MPAVAAATAIIRFTGIILFSTHLSSDGHLQAVVPRISEPPQDQSGISARNRAEGKYNEAGGSVEPHTTFIIFRASDYLSSNWVPPPDPSAGEYMYVKLNGERIEIVADSPNIVERNQARRSSTGATAANPVIDSLKLPHLLSTKLKDDYTESAGFSGAVAVFDLPQGSALGCLYKKQVDTQLNIPNGGRIKIHETKPADKTIILRGGALVYVRHVPTGPHDLHSPSHLQAYYGMSTVPADISAAGDDLLPCPVAALPKGTKVDPPPLVAGDFQCSNSQWP